MTSVETCSSDRRTTWLTSLDYGQHAVSPAKVKLHKLSPDLPYHDIKPPPGVSVIKVEAVHVKMFLGRSSVATLLEPGLCEQDRVDTSDENVPFDKESLFCSIDAAANEGQLCSSNEAGLCDFDCLQSSTLVRGKSEQQINSTYATIGSCAYLTPPPSQETKEERLEEPATASTQQTIHHVSAETLMTSLEIGLRHVMCGAPNRKSKANTITSNEAFDCLPVVAPALWVPKYHRTLSERAVFLPTISHAIANVSQHRSAKFDLKVKGWQVSHRYPHDGKETFSASEGDSTVEVQKALSVALWAAMTVGLNDTKNAKLTRVLRDAFRFANEADAPQDAEAMLDEIAEDCVSDGTCDESDFEDIFDLASEANDESIGDWSIGEIGDIHARCLSEELEDRLVDRWDPEHPSLLDPGSGMTNDETELYDCDPFGDLETGDGDGGDSTGSHREVGPSWHGSNRGHDTNALQYPEPESEGSCAEDMLL